MSLRRWLFVLASFAAAFAAAGVIVRDAVPAGGTLAVPAAWAHLVALVGLAGEILLRALKVQCNARAMRLPLTFPAALRMSLGGDFGAAVTPSRSGAEPARYLVLAEAGIPPAPALILLFGELALETVSLAIIAVGLIAVFGLEGGVPRSVFGLLGGYTASVALVGAAGWLLARYATAGPPPRWAGWLRRRPGRWRAVQRGLRQIRAGVAGLRHANRGLMAASLAASVAHIAVRLAILPALVLGLGASPAEVDLPQLVVWPLVLLYGGAAAPAPAGGGLVEVAFRYTLGDAMPTLVVGSALVWWRLYTFYAYVPLGALAAGTTVLRAIRGRGADPPSETEAAVRGLP